MTTVTVFASGDIAEVISAKLILESAGIPFVVEGEGVQDLFGFGRAMGPFNPITGPVQIRVTVDDAPRAVEALEDLRAGDDGAASGD